MNMRPSKIEMQLAEPSSNTEPCELNRDECRILERALQHYREHHDNVRTELLCLGMKRASDDLVLIRSGIRNLEDKIINAFSITLTPDE